MGGLLGIDNTIFKDRKSVSSSDLDNTINPGAYYVLEQGGVQISNGILLVYSVMFITYQEFYSYDITLRKRRIRWSVSWSDWKDF